MQFGFKIIHDPAGQTAAPIIAEYEDALDLGIVTIVVHQLGGAAGDQGAVNPSTDEQHVRIFEVIQRLQVITFVGIETFIKCVRRCNQ